MSSERIDNYNEDEVQQETDEKILIIVEDGSGQSKTVKCKPSFNCGKLLKTICSRSNRDEKDYRLLHGRTELTDKCNLSDFNITNGSKLYLVTKQVGGCIKFL
ncbi:hypothetical protein A0H76_1769 [Hepatospora eriocheir]|uniref:Ubiquitin-like domain-containing protein n=1 Tax=Hepatospora eriocheir TaxID=1081669 RepID=A0A1X0QGK5_9MICR|nr:hypothetical protein A0H76_1769 [Hepatospora eriocheir]